MKHIKSDFPFFLKYPDLIYLDNAATTHKPQKVLDAIQEFYTSYNTNIGRGVYPLSDQTAKKYENVRVQVANFIGAQPEEIIFTKGTTEGINFIATAWAEHHVGPGDEIVITALEHHANFIPWQQCAARKGAKLKIIPITDTGELDLSNLSAYITTKTRIVAVAHVSNVLGVENDIRLLADAAHGVGARILIDAAQSIPFGMVDLRTLDVDFLVFSGHKMMGPTGIGVLYARRDTHDELTPYQYGGGAVYSVFFEKTIFAKPPHCFEPGTPAIAQVVGFGAALSYFLSHCKDIQKYVGALTKYAIEALTMLPYVKLYGPIEQLKRNGHLISFTIDKVHAHDVAAYLAHSNIYVRAGHHCAQPLAQRLGYDATIRISLYRYNTQQDIDTFIAVLRTMMKK